MRTKGPSQSASDRKGKLVEQIVGWLFEADDATVETRVKLPTLHDRRDKREIDVLLMIKTSVYPVRFVIECKNESQPVGVRYIGDFISKLEAVGIPVQCGIFVATSRFTKGAIRWAEARGIKTLLLSGLTKDRLLAEITIASQSIVYLVPTVTEVKVTNDVKETFARPYEAYAFYDEHGQYRGTIADFVWWMWTINQMPVHLGKHEVEVLLPKQWHNIIDGQVRHFESVHATVEVTGLTISFVGQARQLALSQAGNKEVDRFKLGVQFDLAQPSSPAQTFTTEDELQTYIDSTAHIKVMHRIKVPRICFEMAYWPPSARVIAHVTERMRAFEAGEIADPRPFDFGEVEGYDVKTAWEPIADGYFAMPQEDQSA